MPSYEQFVVYIRSGLHYLYDPVSLRRSPLVELLSLADEFDRAAALQAALVAAIGALKPSEAEPPQSRAWRIYDTLNLHYLRQLPRATVANQLGISERQLRREQRLAIEALAQRLWQSMSQDSSFLPDGHAANIDPVDAVLRRERQDHALPELRIPLGEALENVRSLVQPLAQQANVPVHIYLAPEIGALPVSPIALRTILLSVLVTAISLAAPGAAVITANRRDDAIAVGVTCHPSGNNVLQWSAKEAAALATAKEQAAFFAARLDVSDPAPDRFAVTLLLPATDAALIMVVDDNSDWLELVQRYTAGTPNQIVAIRTPETARDSAGRLQPALILLDVMMHNVDGWQVLSELRNDPATAHIPVVVCTILPLEEMAGALGADGFLQKPVSQQQLLQLLDRQSALPRHLSSAP